MPFYLFTHNFCQEGFVVGLVSLFLCLLGGLLKHFSRGGTWPKISCHIFTDRYLIEIWGGGVNVLLFSRKYHKLICIHILLDPGTRSMYSKTFFCFCRDTRTWILLFLPNLLPDECKTFNLFKPFKIYQRWDNGILSISRT